MGKKIHARVPPKRRNKDRQEVTTRVLVVSEGTVTEPDYFDRFKEKIRSKFSVQLIVRPNSKAKSSSGGRHPDPIHVVKECISLRNKDSEKYSADNDVAPYALCFAVVDVDSYGEINKTGSSTLEKAIKLADSHGVQVIVSNMKFEVWLLWHLLKNIPSERSELDNLCQKNKVLVGGKHLANNFPAENYEEVCVRADRRQKVDLYKIGSNPSTAMPRFFEMLRSYQ